MTDIVCTTWSSPWILQKSLFLWTRREGTPKLNSRKSKTILKTVCSCFGQVDPSAHFLRQLLRFSFRSLFTRVNGDNSNASTIARWKVQLSCWVTEWPIALLYLCACVCAGRGNLSASFLGVSSVFGKRNTRFLARVSRNEPLERWALTERMLERVNAFPLIPWSSYSPIR